MHAKKKIKEALEERYIRLNQNFQWSPENIEKIIALNNELLERYREAYNELRRFKNEFNARYLAGDQNYRDYTLEVEFWYPLPPALSGDEEQLWENLGETSTCWGTSLLTFSHYGDEGSSDIPPFEEVMSIDETSWNDYPFNNKALDGTYIYYFMHEIFGNNETYSLADAVQMKAENFAWQLIIKLEHWGNG